MIERYRGGRRLWNTDEDAALRAAYADERTDAIATRLGRPLSSTYQRAYALGLKKSAAYMASEAACRLRRDNSAGIPYRFTKGQTPANKGLRRPGWGPGRMKATQFKAGQLNGTAAANYMALGSTRLIDGYLYRKVAAVPNVAYTVNWKPVHVLLWTEAHGPVPAGHALVFKNGDKADIRLDNLECLSRRDLMRRNSVHNLPVPLRKAIQLLGAVQRQINKRTVYAE